MNKVNPLLLSMVCQRSLFWNWSRMYSTHCHFSDVMDPRKRVVIVCVNGRALSLSLFLFFTLYSVHNAHQWMTMTFNSYSHKENREKKIVFFRFSLLTITVQSNVRRYLWFIFGYHSIYIYVHYTSLFGLLGLCYFALLIIIIRLFKITSSLT